jgi:hypothetical protein
VGIGLSIVLIAAGAILKWGVTTTVSGLNVQTIGVILMVVGIIGLVVSMLFWSSWGGFGGSYRRRTVHDDGTGRRVVRDDYDYVP